MPGRASAYRQETCVERLICAPDSPRLKKVIVADQTVLGLVDDALIVTTQESEDAPSLVLRCVPPSDHRNLHFVENLGLLATWRGLEALYIGRIRLDQPRTVALLALSTPGPKRASILSSPFEGDSAR